MQLPTYRHWLWIAFLIPIFGCNLVSSSTSGGTIGDGTLGVVEVPKPCGSPALVVVQADNEKSIGIFEVTNDSAFVYFSYLPPVGFTLNDVAIYYGPEHDLPMGNDGKPDVQKFQIHFADLATQDAWIAKLPTAELPPCFFVAAHIAIAKGAEHFVGWTKAESNDSDLPGVAFCLKSCDVVRADCSIQEPQNRPRTFMQDQWSTEIGRRAEEHLRANFLNLFPSGIQIGCNARISFSSVDMLLAALPMKGEPMSLVAAEGEPEDNQLAGELLTLVTLLQLNALVPEFSLNKQPFGGLVIATGAFEGWRVEEVSREANTVLGGCSSNYTPAQMHEVVAAINQSFAPGRSIIGFLRCPAEE